MDSAKYLEQEITECLPHLNIKQKQTVLTVVNTFMDTQKDWWEEISVEQQIAIDKALIEMKQGKVTPREEVMKKYDKWRRK